MPVPVKIIAPVCLCGKRIGYKQYQFEKLLQQGMGLAEATKAMGYTKMCTFGQHVNCPMEVLTDKNRMVFYDESRDSAGNQRKSVLDPYTQDGERILPKRELPKLLGFTPFQEEKEEQAIVISTPLFPANIPLSIPM